MKELQKDTQFVTRGWTVLALLFLFGGVLGAGIVAINAPVQAALIGRPADYGPAVISVGIGVFLASFAYSMALLLRLVLRLVANAEFARVHQQKVDAA